MIKIDMMLKRSSELMSPAFTKRSDQYSATVLVQQRSE